MRFAFPRDKVLRSVSLRKHLVARIFSFEAPGLGNRNLRSLIEKLASGPLVEPLRLERAACLYGREDATGLLFHSNVECVVGEEVGLTHSVLSVRKTADLRNELRSPVGFHDNKLHLHEDLRKVSLVVLLRIKQRGRRL